MNLEKVEVIVEGKGTRPFDVMEALQDIQAEFPLSARRSDLPGVGDA